MTVRIRLGDLLVSSRLVTGAQLEEALEKQKETGRRLGETLVSLGYVTELQVAQMLSHQLSVPWVNLHHVDFSRELLNLVSAEVAVASRVVPIYVRRVRQQGDVLFVATDDPLNEAALRDVASHVGMPVKAMVASALDLRSALRAYYGREIPGPDVAGAAAGSTESPALEEASEEEELVIEVDVPASVVRSLRPPPADVPADAAAEEPADEPQGATAPSASSDALTEDVAREPVAPPPEAATAEEPAPLLRQKKRAPSRPKMLTLTLLDGTTVKLPQPSGARAETPTEHRLTSRDLIQALLLHAEGKDVSSVLRDAHWETLFATLLSLLLKKRLIADWEFVEEWTTVLRSRSGSPR
jgi:type IV pilus assembly protein PilB